MGYICLNEMRTKIAKYYNTKNACRCQIRVLRDYRFQFNIKILSEGVVMIHFISKSSEIVKLLICKRIAGVIFV